MKLWQYALASAMVLAIIVAMQVAHAAEATQPPTTLALTAEEVASWSQVSQAMDACVAGMTLRADATVCRGLSTWLAGFAGRVAIASKQGGAVQPQAPVPSNAPAVKHGPAIVTPWQGG